MEQVNVHLYSPTYIRINTLQELLGYALVKITLAAFHLNNCIIIDVNVCSIKGI